MLQEKGASKRKQIMSYDDDLWWMVCVYRCGLVLAPVLVPMNIGDIPNHLPPLDDYINTIPGNTNFPGLLDNSSSTAGSHMHMVTVRIWQITEHIVCGKQWFSSGILEHSCTLKYVVDLSLVCILNWFVSFCKSLFVWLVFKGTFSTNRLYCAIGVWNILCRAGGQRTNNETIQ